MVKLRINLNIFHIIGLVIAMVMVVSSYFLFQKSSPALFSFLLGIALLIGGFPFFVAIILNNRREAEKEAMFLEFARSLVESVKTGVPISKSIINVKNKNYGSLNPHVEKLANQIYLGIPIKTALETFARDIGNPTIIRSVNIISESEKAGGKIDDILEAVVKSVSQVEKLKKERKNAIFTLVVQGYIIFFIFIMIVLVMQFKVLPIASQIGSQINTGSLGGFGGGFAGIIGSSSAVSAPEKMVRPFLWLLIAQGFFAGLVIGKLSEGKIQAGLKHSFILVIVSFLIQTGATLFFGSPIPK